LNDIEDEFLLNVRTCIQDLFFDDDRGGVVGGGEDQQRNLVKTIVDDNHWYIEEKKYNKMIRFFPAILSEKNHGVYPVMWVAIFNDNDGYNLRDVSLIPLLAGLGTELHQFDEELQGGLLSTLGDELNVLNV
jgi:hypothetical protein